MPKLTDYQRDAIEVIRARLNPADPGFTGDITIRQALTANGVMNPLALYIRSWVLPLLDVIEGDDAWQRDYVARDAARVRSRRSVAEIAINSDISRLELSKRPKTGTLDEIAGRTLEGA